MSAGGEPAAANNGRVRFAHRGELPPVAMSSGSTAWNRTGSWKYLEPVYQDLTAPCTSRCLTGVDVVEMLRRVEAGEWREGALAVLEQNPFPSITGRTCPHPCQQPCNRKVLGGEISVRAVERVLGDRKLADDVRPVMPPPEGAPVAVVGAGPAGLSAAYHLRRRGHPVTVLEPRECAGGILRYGIPAFELPTGVVAAEVEWLERGGVTIRTGVPLDRVEAEPAFREAAAVVWAPSRIASRRLGIPGDDHPALLDAVRLLADARGPAPPRLRGRVGIIGGGNTAIDAARTVLRLGATPVLFYRRTRREMPAFPGAIEAAVAEGIAMRFLMAPVAVSAGPDGRGVAITFVTTELGAKDASGRRAPVAVAGSESVEVLDVCVHAIGGTGPGNGHARPGPASFEASEVDATTGGSVSDAIRNGRRCADAVVAYLHGTPAEPDAPAAPPGTLPRSQDIAKWKQLNAAWFTPAAPHTERVRDLAARSAAGGDVQPPASSLQPDDEVVVALAAADAVAEAARCFKCGTCTECGVCMQFCPDYAIRALGPRQGFAIDLDYCKGCGVCVEECPRAAMHLRRAQ